MGLSFSVPRTSVCPPSVVNMYKALANDSNVVDFKTPAPLHGDLQNWSSQGVLMLNNSLTVKNHNKRATSKNMWHKFTKAIIQSINKDKDGVVFVAWGPKAQAVCSDVDTTKHYVLTFSDPSKKDTRSEKFSECKNFSKVNEILDGDGKSEIDWNVD